MIIPTGPRVTVPAVDVVVVGGGIVGLATAWQLARRRPDLRLALVESESRLGAHQSSHNSGVVHAGIYYPPGSLKAQLCTRGKQLLEDFCAERGVPLERNGKLVVATADDELGRLGDLYARASANGVPGLRRLDARELREVEPAAVGVAAIHSPSTGVVDFAGVVAALARDLADGGTPIHTSWPVRQIRQSGGRVELAGPDGAAMTARAVVVCAGLQADRLAGRAAAGMRVVPFRGGWFTLHNDVAVQVRGSIYPVPDPRLPFLGVHLTRRIDGQVWAGPNAFLAFSRSRYRRWAIDARDAVSALSFPGLWRFAAHNTSAAWTEFRHDVSARAYATALARYLPAVRPQDLERGPMGVRAQAMSRRGQLLDDFLVRQDQQVLHVLNAPSPAATSSLAIGERLAEAAGELAHPAPE